MKKTILYVFVGILAFSISLALVFFFAFPSSSDLETSREICQKCSDFSNKENLETTSLSDILYDKNFQGKKIRIKAHFRHDAGYIFLQDLKNEKDAIPVGFDENAISCGKTQKTLRLCTGYKHWYWFDGIVEITVVGYLGKVNSNSFQKGEEGFNIICIEKVNPSKTNWNKKAKFDKNPFSLFDRK